MKILLDMDGVIVDMVGGVLDYLGSNDPYDDPRNLGNYDLVSLLGMNFWPNLDYDFWVNLKPTREMPEVLKLLESFDTCIVSSPCGTPGCMDGKYDWLRKHVPNLPFLFGKRKEFCSGLLIDDSDANIRAFGYNSVLFPRRWNSNWRLDPVKYLKISLELIHK